MKELKTNDMRAQMLREWRNDASRYSIYTTITVLLYFVVDAIIEPMMTEGKHCALYLWLLSIYPLLLTVMPIYLLFTEGTHWYYFKQMFVCLCSCNVRSLRR